MQLQSRWQFFPWLCVGWHCSRKQLQLIQKMKGMRLVKKYRDKSGRRRVATHLNLVNQCRFEFQNSSSDLPSQYFWNPGWVKRPQIFASLSDAILFDGNLDVLMVLSGCSSHVFYTTKPWWTGLSSFYLRSIGCTRSTWPRILFRWHPCPILGWNSKIQTTSAAQTVSLAMSWLMKSPSKPPGPQYECHKTKT